MKSIITREEYKRIYAMLDEVSPIDMDCGKLCGALCCTCDNDNDSSDYNMGIYLLPGEDKLFTKNEDWLRWSTELAEDYEYPDSWHGLVYFVRCKTPPVCDRKMRPIQCRTYPLTPHINSDGILEMITCSYDLPYECPIIENNISLNESFINTTYEAWKKLITDPLIYDLVKMDSEYRDDNSAEYTVFKK